MLPEKLGQNLLSARHVAMSYAVSYARHRRRPQAFPPAPFHAHLWIAEQVTCYLFDTQDDLLTPIGIERGRQVIHTLHESTQASTEEKQYTCQLWKDQPVK